MTYKLVRPIPILRIEGAVAFVASLIAYFHSGGSAVILVLAFFLPDLSILAYLISPTAGWTAYNAIHSYTWAILLGLAGTLHSSPAMLLAALIWSAHVSWDRLLGFGLKEGENFWITHLGVIQAGRRLWERISGGSPV